MLVNFDLPGTCLHDGGSICLVPRIHSTGIFGRVDRFIGPPDSFRWSAWPFRMLNKQMCVAITKLIWISQALS